MSEFKMLIGGELVPLATSLIGESKCGEIVQRCPLSVTTVTVLRLNVMRVAVRARSLWGSKLTRCPGETELAPIDWTAIAGR